MNTFAKWFGTDCLDWHLHEFVVCHSRILFSRKDVRTARFEATGTDHLGAELRHAAVHY